MGCIYLGKYLSGICLVGEMSVGDVSGRGSARRRCVWSGKCPSEMCLVGEVSVGDVSGRGCVWLGKCLSGKCPSGMCPGIGKKAPLPKICHTYPTMMNLGTVIPYPKKTQIIYESRDTPLKFC